jgi:hypothetical protein
MHLKSYLYNTTTTTTKILRFGSGRRTSRLVAIKTDGKLIGNLHVTIKVERTKGKSNDSCKNESGDALSLALLVGSTNQRLLLAQDSVRMGRFGICEYSPSSGTRRKLMETM